MSIRILPVNFFDEATIAVSPAAVSTLPVTNLQSNVRDRVWRSPNLDQQVITGHWDGNVRRITAWGAWPGDGSSLIGSRWRLQLYADTAWTSELYDSGELDFFTFSGAPWGNDAWGVFRWGVEDGDRTARLAPMVKFITAVNATAFKITVTNGGAVDSPYFESRRMWLADYVNAPYNANFGVSPTWRSSSEHHRTVGGSLRRLTRAKWRELRFETMFATEADRAAWSDLVHSSGVAGEVVLSLFPGSIYPRRERDFTVMGSLEALNPLVFENVELHRLQLAIVES